MMDVWGRAEGFLLMVICATIGLTLMATCHSFEIYCAANVSTMMSPQFYTAAHQTRSSIMLAFTAWNTRSMS